MATKIVVSIQVLGQPVVLRQAEDKSFSLQFCKQTFNSLSYAGAKKMLGCIIMYSAASKGLLETDEPYDMVPQDVAA